MKPPVLPTKPIVSVSLDLDNLWSYLKTSGDPAWVALPSYLDELLEIALERLARHDLRITFFVVGQDAALARHHRALRAIVAAGHEIGNHSFCHEPWFHRWPRPRIEQEIADAEAAIVQATGQMPRGFRGPGYSFSPDVLSVLADRGYLYDASTFPTILGPLARAYYFRTNSLSPEQRQERAGLFGTWKDGFRPLEPYFWHIDGHKSLLEIPVTTLPFLRTPFHISYLLYVAEKAGTRLSLLYLRQALAACRWTGVRPSLLLHPLDFIGGERAPALSFFPGMKLSTAFKRQLFDQVIEHVKEHFEPVTMGAHANLASLELRTAAQLRTLHGPVTKEGVDLS